MKDNRVVELPAHLTARWQIVSSTLIADTRTSHVFRVERRQAAPAIVKALKPEGLHERPGMDFLDYAGGGGAARLLDRDGDIALVEDAGQLTLGNHWHDVGDEASTAIVCALIRQLHAERPTALPTSLTPLPEHFAPLFERSAKVDATPLAADLRMAADIARQLLADQSSLRPLHGDLHHDNILLSPRGWLAIDPQGLIGYPAYEVTNVFGNPDGAFDAVIRPKRILFLTRSFAQLFGCSQIKIIRFAMAHAGLSVCWSLSQGDTPADNENARERHAFLRVAAGLIADGAISD